MRLFSHHSENFFSSQQEHIENIQHPNLLLYKLFPFL